jgi:prevent-host-death family protein
MRTITLSEAKSRFGSLLNEVEYGGEILIIRDGKPAAKLMPVAATHDGKSARSVLVRKKQLGKGVALRRRKIKGLVNKGRR